MSVTDADRESFRKMTDEDLLRHQAECEWMRKDGATENREYIAALDAERFSRF